MNNNTNNQLEKILSNFIEKSIIVNQSGFLESSCCIEFLTYFIKYDILNIEDKNSNVYIKINLNQIYKIENEKDKMLLYLDNDTTITFTLKR